MQPDRQTFRTLLDQAIRQFREAGVESPQRNAHMLICETAGIGKAELMASPDAVLSVTDAGKFQERVSRRLAGEPLHRIIGRREFHGLSLMLSPATLEPRDDTEALVDLVLDHAAGKGEQRRAARFADIGTGTGAIALALLSELPEARAVLTDLSAEALETARANAAMSGFADRCTFAVGSWCEPLSGVFDFIVSNPPYIETGLIDELQPEVRDHDPRLALDGGCDGLEAYRALLSQAPRFLKPQGALFLETGFDQRDMVFRLAEDFGWRRGSVRNDLAGNPRALAVFRNDLQENSREP